MIVVWQDISTQQLQYLRVLKAEEDSPSEVMGDVYAVVSLWCIGNGAMLFSYRWVWRGPYNTSQLLADVWKQKVEKNPA
jgi:hypothetical protein